MSDEKRDRIVEKWTFKRMAGFHVPSDTADECIRDAVAEARADQIERDKVDGHDAVWWKDWGLRRLEDEQARCATIRADTRKKVAEECAKACEDVRIGHISSRTDISYYAADNCAAACRRLAVEPAPEPVGPFGCGCWKNEGWDGMRFGSKIRWFRREPDRSIELHPTAKFCEVCGRPRLASSGKEGAE